MKVVPFATTNTDLNLIVTIDQKTGEGYISQRSIENLFGLSSKSIKRRVIDKMPHLKLNENNQLHEKSLVIAAQVFAKEGNLSAIDLLCKFAEVGARAFIYQAAGFKIMSYDDLKIENKKLKDELMPVIDGFASVSQHLKLLGVSKPKLKTTLLNMITDKVNHRYIEVPKFDREPKNGNESDVFVVHSKHYDTVLVSPELIEQCLTDLGIEF